MTEKVYTYDEVVRIVAKIVLDRGHDYVDSNAALNRACAYAENGRNRTGLRCMVGEFWHRAGVAQDQLAALDDIGGLEEVRNNKKLPVLTTRKAHAFLVAAQRSQDAGDPYGAVLAEALGAGTVLGQDDVEPFTDTNYSLHF